MKFLVRIYLFVINALAVVATAMLAFLVFMIGGEAIMRTLHLPFLPGVVELSEYALFMMAILAAPWLLHNNGHLAVTVVVDRLPHKTRSAAAFLTLLLGLIAAAVTMWVGIQLFMQSYRSGQLIFRDLIIQDWLLQWQVPLAMALIVIEFVARIVSMLRPSTGSAQQEAQ